MEHQALRGWWWGGGSLRGRGARSADGRDQLMRPDERQQLAAVPEPEAL